MGLSGSARERNWVVGSQILTLSPSPITCFTMPMSSRSIPNTQDQYSRSRAAVQVHSQTGNCTNARRAITPFMFNEEEYHVSPSKFVVTRVLNIS